MRTHACPTCTCQTTPQTWLTHLCHVCHRALRRAHPDPSGPLVCTTCRRIDAALARRHAASLLTPLDPRWARGDAVVHTRLHPDDDGADARLREHHLAAVLGVAAAARTAVGTPIARRYPGGPDHARVVDLDAWQTFAPPGPHASAKGYRDYATAVHPWVLDLEPDATDVAFLARLALAR